MNKRKIYYLLHNGKNSHLKYYIKCYLREWIPRFFSQMQLEGELHKLDNRPDKEYILNRVNYYCKLISKDSYNEKTWEQNAVAIKNQPMTNQSTYYHDSMEIARYFDANLKWILISGDTIHIPDLPSITKSRPLAGDNTNNIILTASTNYTEAHPNWQAEKMTIGEHLDYKFVMSLEGNDVASNLKWVMSSNSIAVTPRLTCETWFMEGTLKPNYHYIEVNDDFSNLEERLQYYIDHPEEAEAIIKHAHEYVDQFRDKEREKLISLLVLKKYFEITNKVEL